MLNKTRVLVVEDEVLTREGLSLVLNTFEYDVVEREDNAKDAMTKALKLNPDVVLIDRELDKALKDHSNYLEKLVKQRTKKLEDTQAQLVRKERLALLGQISGSIGHELRSPLETISNAVCYLQSTVKCGEKTKEYLGMIESEIRRAENIVTNLLSFSHSRVADREDVSISSVVNWALNKQPFVKGVEVITNIDPSLKAFIDPGHLESILNNIIANAYQTMPDGGVLHIDAYKEGKNITLLVSDTGKGIAPRDMKVLFEPLYTTKPKGIGLGLAITKNLVEVNGGSISVKSKLGKGSVFVVTLPVRKKRNAR